MKNICLVFCAILLIASASCKKGDFLDSKALDVLTREVTFADSAKTMDFLTGIYLDLAFNYTTQNTSNIWNFSPESDEAEGRYPALGNFDKQFAGGTFSGNFWSTMDNQWSLFYKDIHNANVYLAEVDNSPLSESMKKRTKAEARFLRVFYYSFLTKYYGGVPLVGDKAYSTEDPNDLVRSSYEECVNYMVSELDAIANELPVSYIGLNYGRVTKGACLALKSRILLFAASPLYNGGSTATTPELIAATAYPTYDATRWEKARLAAKSVMDLGLYSLNTDNTTRPGNGFYKAFITRVNNEFILPRPMATGKGMEQAMNPKSRGGAGFFFYPTQDLVDMFPMKNGLPIKDPASGYNEAANPYLNRDPRLDYTVIYNESLYFLNTTKTLQPVYTYVGAPNDGIVALSSNTATLTGYYVRKFCDEYAAVTGGGNVDRSLPVIRYAEVLLNYAEAANEVGGSTNMTEALNALKLLRIRAGITANTNGQYGLPATPTQAQLRDLIRNERAIELAFEQHRMWDVRRWKIGALIDSKILQGMQITKIGTTGSNYTYKRIDIRRHYFKEVYYYFPIPKADVTLNAALLQNPGY